MTPPCGVTIHSHPTPCALVALTAANSNAVTTKTYDKTTFVYTKLSI